MQAGSGDKPTNLVRRKLCDERAVLRTRAELVELERHGALKVGGHEHRREGHVGAVRAAEHAERLLAVAHHRRQHLDERVAERGRCQRAAGVERREKLIFDFWEGYGRRGQILLLEIPTVRLARPLLLTVHLLEA